MSGSRTPLLVLAAFVLFCLAIPTAAITVGEDQAGDLSLSPSDDPNGRYADVDADGELSVEMNRLNDRATTTADDVFAITNTDREAARVWIEHDLEGTTFYRGSDRSASVESERNAIELAPGETATVGVRADTREAEIEPGAITIRAEGVEDLAPEFVVTDVAVEGLDGETSVAVGDTVRITATVANRGNEGGTYAAELTVDGVVVAQRTVYVPAGKTRTVTFERTFQRSGAFEIGIGGSSGGTVAVRDPNPIETAASFEVRNASLSSSEIRPGETVDATATVANDGNASGRFRAELAVGGVVLETRTVEVPPGEARNVTFTRRFERPGTYQVHVAGLDAGELTVSDPDRSGITSERRLRNPATGVFGLSLIAGALVVGRRRADGLIDRIR